MSQIQWPAKLLPAVRPQWDCVVHALCSLQRMANASWWTWKTEEKEPSNEVKNHKTMRNDPTKMLSLLAKQILTLAQAGLTVMLLWLLPQVWPFRRVVSFADLFCIQISNFRDPPALSAFSFSTSVLTVKAIVTPRRKQLWRKTVQVTRIKRTSYPKNQLPSLKLT